MDKKAKLSFENNKIKINTFGNSEARAEIDYFFAPLVDNYYFMPAYKMGTWDGRLHFFKNGTLPPGLYKELLTYLRDKEYIIEPEDSFKQKFTVKIPIEEEHFSFKKFKLRDYQIETIKALSKYDMGIARIATGGGKMAMIITTIKMILYKDPKFKILIIVPRQQLVEQLFKEFNVVEYSNKNVGRLYGSSKEAFENDSQIVIATWQTLESLRKQGNKYFEKFDSVIVDEVHTAKATVLSNILSNMSNANIRYGFTGTLPRNRADLFTIKANLGEISYEQGAETLQKKGVLAQINVTQLKLNWGNKELETFQQEKKWIENNNARNEFIANIVKLKRKNNNILILVEKIAHGQTLLELIEKDDYEHNYFIEGSIDVDEREKIRILADNEKSVVIVATYGTFSMGINIKNLDIIIFASPGKSEIRTLQSIGRGLRKTEDKQKLELYDIIDNTKYSLKHHKVRQAIYENNKFPYITKAINFIC